MASARVGPLGSGVGLIEWWPLSNERWLVTENRYGGESARAWLVEEANPSPSALPNECLCTFEAVSPVSDGGFVALVTFHQKYSQSSTLFRVDATRKISWRIDEDLGGDETDLFSPEDVAVTPHGEIVVVDVIRKVLQFFDLSGAHLRNLDLEEILPVKPGYPTGVEPDPLGAVLLHDFSAEIPLHRIRKDGEVSSSIGIVSPDGRPVRALHGAATVAPDGSIWTTDGQALLRIDAQGRVDSTVGEATGPETLAEPGATVIDPFGRILVQDDRTGVLHAFDGSGELLFSGLPAAGDFDEPGLRELFVDPTGSIYVQTGILSSKLIQFSPGGERIGPAKFGSNRVAFCPDGSRWLAFDSFDYVGLQRRDGHQTLAKVARTPNGLWFENIGKFAAGTKGELFVLGSREEDWSHPSLSLFESDGSPQGTIAVNGFHAMGLAVCDEWLVVGPWNGEALLVRRADRTIHSFVVPDASPLSRHTLGFSPDGAELWLVESAGPMLHKFALP